MKTPFQRGKPGRPPMDSGKKDRILRTRLTEAEYQVLAGQLAASGLTISALIRARLLASGPAVPMDTRKLMGQLDTIGGELGRSGNNINQLARHANTMHRYGTLSEPVIARFLPMLQTYLAQQRELGNRLRAIIRMLSNR